MAAQMKNRFASVAGLALAAGLSGIAATPAKADFDWSFSLNLGWCDPAPYCAPVSYCAPVTYCAPVACYTPVYHYYRPYYYGSYYYNPYYYNPWGGYYYSAPVYAFSTPLYLPSGGTYVYSGCGFTYTSTTFYTPYATYYAPAANWGLGLSFTYSSHDYDCDRDNWRHGHRGHDRNRAAQLPSAAGLTPRNDFTSRGPMSNSFASNGGKPQVNEAPGVAGPPAIGEVQTGQKGPRQVAPVAVKPIESKTPGSKPVSFPQLAQSKPTNPRLPVVDTGAQPTVKPASFTQKPSVPEKPVFTEKPSQAPARPSMPVASKPIEASKPSMPVASKPTKSPELVPEKTPSRALPTARENKPFTQAQKPSLPYASPDVKPSSPVSEKPAAMPGMPSRQGTAMPRTQPAQQPRYERSPIMDAPAMPSGKGPSMPSAKPSSPRAYAPAAAPLQRASAPSAAPRASAPAPRASAPSAPSGPRQSAPAPMPGGKGGGSDGGKRR